MKRLKDFFKKWDISRYLRLIIGLVLGMAYLAEGETLYLGISVFFLVQAVMNIGCGTNCATGVTQEKTTSYNIEKYNKNNN